MQCCDFRYKSYKIGNKHLRNISTNELTLMVGNIGKLLLFCHQMTNLSQRTIIETKTNLRNR